MDREYIATIRQVNYDLEHSPMRDLFAKEKEKAFMEMAGKRSKGKYCQHCIYADRIHWRCLQHTSKMKESCWKAKGVYLLKKEGIYGQPNKKD